jgi:hypothetical protein
MVESFGPQVTGFCRFCYGNDEAANIQTHFHDSDFKARSADEHEADVNVAELIKTNIHGVKSHSCFRSLKHFDAIKSFPPDVLNFLVVLIILYYYFCTILVYARFPRGNSAARLHYNVGQVCKSWFPNI